MYGTKAYPAFTLDKVIASFIKHVISIINDSKSQDLVELLKTDREARATSTKQQIAYRMAAEGVLSADENMYKLDWMPTSQKLRISLLAKDDPTVDDLQTAEQKWEAYIDSYALVSADSPALRTSLISFLRHIRRKVCDVAWSRHLCRGELLNL